MVDFIKKYNTTIIVSFISIMILFLSLTFLNGKGKISLTDHDRELMKYDQYQDGDENITGTDSVTFDAYFYENIGGTPTKIRGNYLNINENAELWLDIHVFGEATLKDAKLQFVNGNVKTSGYLYKNSFIPSNTTVPNGGNFNLVSSISGATLNQKITVSANLTNTLDSLSNSTNKIILTGKVVKPDGTETNITKEVSYTVDWYLDSLNAHVGTFNIEDIYMPYEKVYGCEDNHALLSDNRAYYHKYTGENYKLTFKLKTFTSNPFLKSANIIVTIPELNGQQPIDVYFNDTNVTYTYDATTRTLTARRDATLDGTLITKNAYSYKNGDTYYNDWNIIVEYPKEIEVDSAPIVFDVDTWYEEYEYRDNVVSVNTSDVVSTAVATNFKKPLIRQESELMCDEVDRFVIGQSVSTSTINKTSILKKYNNEESAPDRVPYRTTWSSELMYFDKYYEDTIQSITLSDVNPDKSTDNSFENISYYKSIFVYNAGYWLGSSGYIKIIDNNTDKVLYILTALDWDNYYTFTEDVSSIRLETSPITNVEAMDYHYRMFGWTDNNTLSLFTVYANKEIDTANLVSTYDLATFDAMKYLTTYLSVRGTRVKANGTTSTTNLVVSNASAPFKTLQSANVELNSNKTTIDSTVINNVSFTISIGDTNEVVVGYKDADYLLVLPEWILDVDVNSITPSNTDVKVLGYEVVTINDRKCIKISTKNANELKYSMILDADVTPDARQVNSTGRAEIYALNPSVDLADRTAQDIYDIDLDNDTTEEQNYGFKSLTLAAPNEVITTTTINYKDVDANGVTVVSPMVADVNPLEDDTDAEIEIGITNNSLYPTKDFKIIGKIGFVGNTYQIGDGDLGSEYNVKMENTGISIPTELEGKATIYYSDKETPTEDLNNASNNWKTKDNVADFDAIKTYMIVINDYTLSVGDSVKFTYDIEIPNNTSGLNKKTYFTHGVYYNIVTDAGDLPSSVGGAKLGINLARRYDLELVDYKKSSDRTINGSKYVITSYDAQNKIVDQKILTTDANGYAKAKDLYAGFEYEIKQENVKYPYILDEEIKTISVVNGANDVLTLQTNGTFKTATLTTDHLVNIDHENDVRYDLVLTNTDLDTDAIIPYSKFNIKGKGYETGKDIVANSNGQLTLYGLYLDEVYEFEQLNVNGYLLTNKFTIKLTRDNNGDIKINVAGKPIVEEIVNINSTYYFKHASDSRYGNYYKISSGTRYKLTEGYFPLDLTNLQGEYTLKVPYYYDLSNSSYLYMYLSDSPDVHNNYFLYENQYHNYSLMYAETDKYYDTYGQQHDLVGGKKYYLYLKVYNYYRAEDYVKILTPELELKNGESIEYLVSDSLVNVATFENEYATQTLTDSDNQDSPILSVLVKNKAIPSYTLEITKVNAETKEPLANAQYKVTGDGLPNGAKYITTDENGKATIKLQKEVKPNYSGDSVLINGIDFNQYNPEYTIEEAVAPVGYTLDSNKVKFKVSYVLQNGTMDWGTTPYVYTTDLATEDYNEMSYLLSTEANFKEANWDNTTQTLSVTMYDYPIISITKKDAETGELLPNTVFAINQVENVNGNEVLVPAFDSKGEIVGTKTTINNKDYYVVATNEDGEINLDLGVGKYRVQEVKAADEKYEINNAVYYFGVGETVPYQEPGVNLVGTISASGYQGPQNSTIYAPKFIKTDDDGIAYTTCTYSNVPNCYLIKKDKDGNTEWQSNASIYSVGTGYYITYADDPDRKVFWSPESWGAYRYPYALVQTSDGGYAISYIRDGIVVKFDKDGNRLWQNQNSNYYYTAIMDKVCTYEGNTDADGKVRLYKDPTFDGTNLTWEFQREETWNSDIGDYEYGDIIYKDIKNYDPNNEYEYMGGAYLRDDDTYYCHFNSSAQYPMTDLSRWYESSWEPGTYYFNGDAQNINTFNSYKGYLIPTNDGGVMLYYGGNSDLMLYDGTIVDIQWQNSFIRYDANGNMIAVYNIDELLYNAEEAYLNKYNLTTGHRLVSSPTYNDFAGGEYFVGIKSYPNGDFLFTGANGFIAKFAFNETTNNYEVVFFTPVGANGWGLSQFFSNYDQTYEIHLTEDGGFTFGYERSAYINISMYEEGSSSRDPYYDTELQHVELNQSITYNYINPLFEYDSEGKLKNVVIVGQSDDPSRYPEEMYHLRGYNYGSSFIPLDDGSFLVTAKTGQYAPQIYDGTPNAWVMLANGQVEILDSEASFIVFLVNKDSRVEWVRQYKGVTALSGGNQYVDSLKTSDGKYWLVPVMISGTEFEDLETGEVYQAAAPGETNFLKFELLDAIDASGPEAYTLNINNSRKEFKITATSNVGGEVVVTNPANGQNVTSTTGDTTTLELVKYGDDNKYTITITPNNDYAVGSVTVNGKDATYTINNDGTVVLGKIEDIREDKNIKITYVPHIYGLDGEVVVKHYKKGTTEQVFKDDIILGAVGDPYLAEPKNSELYDVETDESGEYIFPDNMSGNIDVDQTVVIFYYVEKEVELKVNYYLDGTETEVAPPHRERKTLGSTYQTSPLNITDFDLVDTIGDESGTLTRNLTEVTYMYAQSTDAKIKIRYVDKATNKDIIEPIIKTVPLNDAYSTDDPVNIPSNYRFTNVVGKTAGLADNSNIEVIYYYEVIPFNVSVDKKINSVLLNGKSQNITNGKNITISPFKKDDLVVTYEIIVENTGEIKATFKVVEKEIPGFVITDKGEFTKVGNNYELNVELEPGEKKTYKITYKWNQKDYGISVNEVSLTDVTNANGFDEPDGTDNISTAKVETTIPKEVLDDPPVIIPPTVDKILSSIVLFMVSIIGMITLIILTRKKRMN